MQSFPLELNWQTEWVSLLFWQHHSQSSRILDKYYIRKLSSFLSYVKSLRTSGVYTKSWEFLFVKENRRHPHTLAQKIRISKPPCQNKNTPISCPISSSHIVVLRKCRTFNTATKIRTIELQRPTCLTSPCVSRIMEQRLLLITHHVQIYKYLFVQEIQIFRKFLIIQYLAEQML